MTAIAGTATYTLTGEKLAVSDVVLLYAQVLLICAGADYLAGRLGVHLTPRSPADREVVNASIEHHGLRNPDEPFFGALPDGRRLLQRLTPAQRGRIRCLSVEDHYVRIHTDRGAPLVLMRFSDALAELDGVPDERVHRSWWVASVEPCVFRRDGRKAILELADRLTIPVSTPYLRAAG